MIRLHNPTNNAPIDTVSNSGPVVIECGKTASVTQETADELLERYPFLQVVSEEASSEVVTEPAQDSDQQPADENKSDENKQDETLDLTKLNKTQLADLAKERGVEINTAMTKPQMIDKLSLQ